MARGAHIPRSNMLMDMAEQELQNPPDDDVIGASPMPTLGKHQRRLSAQGFNLFRNSVDNEGFSNGRSKSNSWDAQGPLVAGQRNKSNSWDVQPPSVKHFRTQSRESNPTMAEGAAAIEINNLKNEVAKKVSRNR